MGTIWYNFWIQGILKTFIKFLKPIDKKLIRKYQNNTFINYTNMDYLPILAMQIQEKHAQLQPQDKFCTCSRKAIWLLSLILWKFSILNPGEKKKKKKKKQTNKYKYTLKNIYTLPFLLVYSSFFFFPTPKSDTL